MRACLGFSEFVVFHLKLTQGGAFKWPIQTAHTVTKSAI